MHNTRSVHPSMLVRASVSMQWVYHPTLNREQLFADRDGNVFIYFNRTKMGFGEAGSGRFIVTHRNTLGRWGSPIVKAPVVFTADSLLVALLHAELISAQYACYYKSSASATKHNRRKYRDAPGRQETVTA